MSSCCHVALVRAEPVESRADISNTNILGRKSSENNCADKRFSTRRAKAPHKLDLRRVIWYSIGRKSRRMMSVRFFPCISIRLAPYTTNQCSILTNLYVASPWKACNFSSTSRRKWYRFHRKAGDTIRSVAIAFRFSSADNDGGRSSTLIATVK